LLASTSALVAVAKAESVNANCACHGASRSATRFASIAAASANNAVNSKGSFASKEAAITVLKEANAAFNVAIQALDSVKRNQADDTVWSWAGGLVFIMRTAVPFTLDLCTHITNSCIAVIFMLLSAFNLNF
jgi:hypothetical protein